MWDRTNEILTSDETYNHPYPTKCLNVRTMSVVYYCDLEITLCVPLLNESLNRDMSKSSARIFDGDAVYRVLVNVEQASVYSDSPPISA
jgi:hypothetical protein